MIFEITLYILLIELIVIIAVFIGILTSLLTKKILEISDWLYYRKQEREELKENEKKIPLGFSDE